MSQSDLAVEFSKKLKPDSHYTKRENKLQNGMSKTTISIISDEASKLINREKGLYITLNFPKGIIFDRINEKMLITELKKAIVTILKSIKKTQIKSALIVGLGNPKMLADCLGAKVTEKILVTRHIIGEGGILPAGLAEVSTINCGVLGTTGIESADTIKGIVERIKPEVVIVIDTLVADSMKRLCTSFQVANVGIVPGGGIDNERKAVSQKFLNVPVISLGVPLIVSAGAICQSILPKNAINSESGKFSKMIVMSKDMDEEVKFSGRVLSRAINLALHRGLTQKTLAEWL